jgi:hypothetical protein
MELVYASLITSAVVLVALLILEETYTVKGLLGIIGTSLIPFLNFYILLYLIQMLFTESKWLAKKWRKVTSKVNLILNYKLK